ncbi:MAG: hypothetical protein HZB51_08070 [Chloroflexi bacterium]|nr:hypothetical protein [Chloroflexota bacterium]
MKKISQYRKLGIAISILIAILAIVFFTAGTNAAGNEQRTLASVSAVGTGFTYQGQLKDNGNPANGAYDLQFGLYDAVSIGAQIGITQTLNDVIVINGLFTVKLDFGTAAFGGGARWLNLAVRPGASVGAYTTLTPRQEITPAPYALALPNVYTDESVNFVGIGRNFRISGNEVFGIRYTGSPNQYGGMYVETSSAGGWPFYGYATNGSFRAWTYYNGTTGSWYLYSAGIRLEVPSTGGLRIGPALDYSLVISNTTGSDGIRVLDTGDDAIQIGSNPDIPNYGVYIPSPGVSTYGVWSNTSNASGEWALYTVDKIIAGNVAAGAFSLVAQVTGPAALTIGDVVVVTGMADPLPGSQPYTPLVRRADGAQYTGVIGVVENRMVWEPSPGKEEFSLHSANGLATAGDYVSLVIYGIAQVKVDSTAVIAVGDRVTASGQAGGVRHMQTRLIDGMVVAESAQSVGIALASPTKGQTTIPVFVTLR